MIFLKELPPRQLRGKAILWLLRKPSRFQYLKTQLPFPSAEALTHQMLPLTRMKKKILTQWLTQGLSRILYPRGNHLRFKRNSHLQSRRNLILILLLQSKSKTLLLSTHKPRRNYLLQPHNPLMLLTSLPPQLLIINNPILHVWTNEHPPGQIIGNLSIGIQTQSSHDPTDHCHYATFMSADHLSSLWS